MHEHHAVKNLFDQVLEKAKLTDAARITKVVIVMGELLGFDEGSVRLYFDQMAEGTIAQAAALAFTKPPTLFKCQGCNAQFPRVKGEFACPACKSDRLSAASGKEFYIQSIEVE
ncbi:MAG: hydrogenase maturation nickel metallochaperone HypA [Candidatus Omnitrophica bacterium]|nr:hydrogenase maturation nickel metallochaperone HypA [Candidatus Omnitrophota bacterium]